MTSAAPSPSLASKTVEAVLTSDWKILSAAVAAAAEETTYARFLPDVTPFERQRFLEPGPLQDLIRRLVLIRFQFHVFEVFVPRLRPEADRFYPQFLPLLADLVTRCSALETDLEETVRKAADARDEATRKELNASSTSFHEAKMACFTAVADRVPPLGKVPEETVLQAVAGEAHRYRDLHREAKAGSEYAAPLFEKQETERKRQMFRRIAVTAVLVLGAAWIMWHLVGPGIRSRSMELPFPVVNVQADEESMQIETFRNKWDGLSDADVQTAFRNLEAQLKAKRGRQAKIVDESGEVLGVVFSSAQGKQIHYTHRRLK